MQCLPAGLPGTRASAGAVPAVYSSSQGQRLVQTGDAGAPKSAQHHQQPPPEPRPAAMPPSTLARRQAASAAVFSPQGPAGEDARCVTGHLCQTLSQPSLTRLQPLCYAADWRGICAAWLGLQFHAVVWSWCKNCSLMSGTRSQPGTECLKSIGKHNQSFVCRT